MTFSLTARRGIAIPIVMGLFLCMAVWIGSLSWTMTNSRSRFQHALKLRRAYFMARSALQHFFLKVKILQRQVPEAVMALETASPENWGPLSKTFIEDVVLPVDLAEPYSASYAITSFTIGTRDLAKAQMTIEIQAEGKVDGLTETIRRINRVSR